VVRITYKKCLYGLLTLSLLCCKAFGNPCTVAITVSPPTTQPFTIAGLGGPGQFFVNTGGINGTSCHWVATKSPFISVSPASGGGGAVFQFTVNFTVDANPNLAARTGFITVTQQEDGTSKTYSVQQNANPGNFTLTVTPTGQNIVPGGTTSYAVAINRTGGFTGAVCLTASGLPSGVTPSFDPACTSGNSSTMTLTATGVACAGDYLATINGSNASVNHQTTANVTVVGGFSLSSAPDSEPLVQGLTTSVNVSINRLQGFAAPITFTISGLPTGASASFSPNNTTGSTSTMTVTLDANSPTGGFPLVISGTSGCITHTAPNTLMVSPSWWPAIQSIIED